MYNFKPQNYRTLLRKINDLNDRYIYVHGIEDLILFSIKKQNYEFLVFTHRGNRDWAFVPIFSKLLVWWTGLGKQQQYLPIELQAGMLITQYKRLFPWAQNFSPVIKPTADGDVTWPSVLTLREMGLRKPEQENANVRATIIVIIKSFVSSLGILCLLPVSIKW